MSAQSDVETDAEPLGSDSELYLSLKEQEQYVKTYFDKLSPELKVDYHDGMILYHEDDYEGAEKLRETLCRLSLRNGKAASVVLYNGPDLMSLAGGEFDNLEDAFNHCTFTFIYLSELFVNDKVCKLKSQSCLMGTIDDVTKNWCVIPVLTAPRKQLNFKIPMGLNALKELNFYPANVQFGKCVVSLFNTFSGRVEKQEALIRKRYSYLKEQTIPLSNDEVHCSQKSDADLDNTVNDLSNRMDNLNNLRSPKSMHLTNAKINRDSCKTPLQTGNQALYGVYGNKNSDSGLFLKKNDDKDLARNNRIIAKASYSVGIICGPNSTGTGFRVGSKYVATARHVVLQNTATNGAIDREKVESDRFLYVAFEFLRPNQLPEEKLTFSFSEVVYENVAFDTIILQLKESAIPFPPPISAISKVQEESDVYLLSHVHGLPQMIDPKIEFYKLDIKDVQNSKRWAASNGIPAENDYNDIENQDKILFHCASQHGASGALGVMVDYHSDEPKSVLMLLRGYPDFFYRNQSFTDADRKNFLIVEQGILLSSIYEDMSKQSEYNDITEDIMSTISNENKS